MRGFFLSAGQGDWKFEKVVVVVVGGNFDNFFKTRKILTFCLWTGGENVSMQNISNKDRKSDFGTTRMPSKRFFFHFTKADKTNKTDDICFKCETRF